MTLDHLPKWPHYSEAEISAVSDVLRSGKVNYWTGQECKQFEKEFATYIGCRYGIALANGTAALELALRSAGIGSGDEVVVTCRSFIASASSIVICGARPVFADVDSSSQNITADTITKCLSNNTRAIVLVHLAGMPCDMDPIIKLAKEHNLVLIEDCAQAHGAEYKGRKVGSLGDIVAFSFCQDKIMSTGGEGGMMVTDNEEYWRRAWAYKDHGKDYDMTMQPHAGGFRWAHNSIGTNLRMTEMQAAIGRIQLGRLDEWVGKRNDLASVYTDKFKQCSSLVVPDVPEDIRHAYYKYYAFVDKSLLKQGIDRDIVLNMIVERGVPCFVGTCSEIYREAAFSDEFYQPSNVCETSKLLGETSLVFLVHPTLSLNDVETMASVVVDVMDEVTIDQAS